MLQSQGEAGPREKLGPVTAPQGICAAPAGLPMRPFSPFPPPFLLSPSPQSDSLHSKNSELNAHGLLGRGHILLGLYICLVFKMCDLGRASQGFFPLQGGQVGNG